MSKRTRKLAEQAGIDFFNSTDPEYSGRVYCEAWTEQQQKFAELIVEECVKVAHPKLTDVGEWAAGMRLVQQRLKQHFGVE